MKILKLSLLKIQTIKFTDIVLDPLNKIILSIIKTNRFPRYFIWTAWYW